MAHHFTVAIPQLGSPWLSSVLSSVRIHEPGQHRHKGAAGCEVPSALREKRGQTIGRAQIVRPCR
jgi:hypothetical protein